MAEELSTGLKGAEQLLEKQLVKMRADREKIEMLQDTQQRLGLRMAAVMAKVAVLKNVGG